MQAITIQTKKSGLRILEIQQRVKTKSKLLTSRLLSNDERTDKAALHIVNIKAGNFN